MSMKTAADFDPEVLILFDAYVHGALDRRGFLDRAAKSPSAASPRRCCSSSSAPSSPRPSRCAKDDPRLKAEFVEYASPQGYGKMRGYLVRPAKAAGKLPGVVVIHENRGLNPHIEDIARRVALDNFIAFAPDALTPLGGYPAGGEDEARALFGKLEQPKTREDMVAAAAFLKGHAECTGRLGAVGFCYGGGIANLLATRVPEVVAAVAFYGAPAPIEDVPKIKGQVLIHYAGNDERVERLVAGLRGRSQGRRREVRDVHVSRHRARLQQRHDAPLRQSGGEPGLEAHHRPLQRGPASVGRRMPRLNALGQPVGDALDAWRPPPRPAHAALEGRWARLEPLSPERHGRALFAANALDTDGRNWTYLPIGPFATFEDYDAWLRTVAPGQDPMFFTIVDRERDRPVGVASYLRIEPAAGSIEVGHINVSPLAQRTRCATDALYQMMRHAFALGYRRYEWKCDALNEPSRVAATRFGFTYEGLFRQALVYKGRNRDTAWYSIVDHEFPAIDAAYQAWLADANFDAAGQQRRRLADLIAAHRGGA